MNDLFEEGHFYRRRLLHQAYGGQQRGGISTPAHHPLIFLFTGEPGEPFGYTDWQGPDGTFHYYGEGQRGDMDFRGGNTAIRDHAANGKELHLFQMKRHDSSVRYLGQMVCVGYDLASGEDVDHKVRKAIVFRLRNVKMADDPAGREGARSSDRQSSRQLGAPGDEVRR